jgi:hypothetical protein
LWSIFEICGSELKANCLLYLFGSLSTKFPQWYARYLLKPLFRVLEASSYTFQIYRTYAHVLAYTTNYRSTYKFRVDSELYLNLIVSIGWPEEIVSNMVLNLIIKSTLAPVIEATISECSKNHIAVFPSVVVPWPYFTTSIRSPFFFEGEEFTHGPYPPLARRRACVGFAQRLIIAALGIPTKTPRLPLVLVWRVVRGLPLGYTPNHRGVSILLQENRLAEINY